MLLLIVLPDVYQWLHAIRRRHYPWWERLLWLLPGLAMTAFTVVLATTHNFVPTDFYWIRLYMALVGVYVLPKFLYVLCSAIGTMICRWRHSHQNWGRLVGIVLCGAQFFIFVYGYTIGFSHIEVRHVDLYVDRLPARFDGFRIALFSDAHVGTYIHRHRDILRRAVDSLNAQRADIICFTGDLQNALPTEITPVAPLLSRLHARYGMYSVLGNHDYSMYTDGSASDKAAHRRQTIEIQQRMGWQVLRNEHRVIRIGADSIFVAGMENDGEPPFPAMADARATMAGIPAGAFTVMLEHDPSSWTRTILPLTQAQLTLSGHTHGGQLQIGHLRPTQLRYRHDLGLYHQAGRYLYVSAGLGGVVPFRFGVAPEVTLITLHHRHQ